MQLINAKSKNFFIFSISKLNIKYIYIYIYS